ncbi:MAG: ParB N-terminal domain-containing protein [Conexivisphaerales archaeon]
MMYIFVELDRLVPHEMHDENHAREIADDIRKRGVLLRPIVIHKLENGKYMVVDGHHRTTALKQLGCKYAAATLIDYASGDIRVMSWKGDKAWEKKEIVARAVTGKLLPPKTTKHEIKMKDGYLPFYNNDAVEPVIAVELTRLKDGY